MSEIGVRVRDLRKSFSQGGRRLEILKGIDAEFPAYRCSAILGQSGSGKSTLLGLLAGLDQPDTGFVELFGKSFSGLSFEALREIRAKSIGIVFQQFHLLPNLTALENVLLPLELRGETNQSEGRELLEKLGLGHRLDHFPAQLSGGECQRVAIARALVIRPQLVLADEPSGNLDPDTGSKFMDLFFSLLEERKMTAILVTHNSALAERCHARFHLESGQFHKR